MKRHNARIFAAMTLYQNDLLNESRLKELAAEDQIKNFNEFKAINEEEISNLEVDQNFYQELIDLVNNHLKEIDDVIKESLVKWTLNRLAYLDRAILRLATAEMLYTITPKEIVINEALDITKDYSETDDYLTVKFNNKVLDTIKEKIENGRQ